MTIPKAPEATAPNKGRRKNCFDSACFRSGFEHQTKGRTCKVMLVANLSQHTEASFLEAGDMRQPGIIPRAALQCQFPEIQNDVDGTPRLVPFQVDQVNLVVLVLALPFGYSRYFHRISIRCPSRGQSHWLPTACV